MAASAGIPARSRSAGKVLSDEAKEQPQAPQSNEQIRLEIEQLLGNATSKLGDVIKEGGVKNQRYKCDKCGNSGYLEVKVADADLLVKAVSALSSAAPRLKADDDSASQRAMKILDDLSELGNAELADYIAELEAQLATAD